MPLFLVLSAGSCSLVTWAKRHETGTSLAVGVEIDEAETRY